MESLLLTKKTGKIEIVVKSYLKKILKSSDSYLKKIFTNEELNSFLVDLNKVNNIKDNQEVINRFIQIYQKHIKQKYQKEENPNYNKKLFDFIKINTNKVKILWGDCEDYLKQLPAESIQLMVTSPPYYNAREYSQWKNLNDYIISKISTFL